jgi:hypothetical protein
MTAYLLTCEVGTISMNWITSLWLTNAAAGLTLAAFHRVLVRPAGERPAFDHRPRTANDASENVSFDKNGESQRVRAPKLNFELK